MRLRITTIVIVIGSAIVTGACGVKGPLFLTNAPKEGTWPYLQPKNASVAPVVKLVGPPFPVPVAPLVGPPYPLPETTSAQPDAAASSAALVAPEGSVSLTPAGPSHSGGVLPPAPPSSPQQ